MFDGYRDVTKIGEGGLGTLYRAVRESTGGVVAIKELRDVGEGSPAWHRARRELEALLRLKGHPYVVNVEEIIEGPSGPCLVMEFAAGGSLADRLSGGALPGPELVLVGEHVTQALAAAHGVGIVHRDVKPHNLLIGAFGQVKVCDFGIAALIRGSEGRTQTHAMTLAYASPEELDGVDEIGPPADVYSFGATFLHLATGKRPSFRDRTDANILEQLRFLDSDAALSALPGLMQACLLHDPDRRPTMSDLYLVFDQAGVKLENHRIRHLTVPRPPIESIPQREDANEETVARTVIRPVPLPPPQAPPNLIETAAPQTLLALADIGATVARPNKAAADGDENRDTSPPSRPVSKIALVTAAVVVVLVVAVAGLIIMNHSSKTAAKPLTTQASAPSTEASTPTTPATPTTQVNPPTTQANTPAAYAKSATLNGHTDVVNWAAFSTDSTRIVTASLDSKAIIWDATTGAILHTLAGHTGFVNWAGFSPDGTEVVTASFDGKAIIWDATSGAILHTLAGHTDWVNWAGFSPDGTKIVTASADSTAIIWDTTTGAIVHTLTGHTHGVSWAGFSPDGTKIVTAGGDNTAIIWDATAGTVLHTLTAGTFGVNLVAFSPDSTRIVTTSLDSSVIVWDTTTGAIVHTLTGHTSAVNWAAFSPDGTKIVTASGDNTAIIWDATTGAILHTLSGHTKSVNRAGFSPDGTKIVTASGDNTAIIWDVGTGEMLHTLTGHTNSVSWAGFSPNGTKILTTSADRTGIIWGTATSK